MEPNTRPLSLEEMYFKKPVKAELASSPNPNSVNKGLLDSGGELPYTPLVRETPKMDLSDPVFPLPSFSKKAGKFVAKNWVWLLVGAGVLVAIGVSVHKEYKKKKKGNRGPIYPRRQA